MAARLFNLIYLYAQNNPVDNDDPSGEDSEMLDVMDFSEMFDSIGFPVAATVQQMARQVARKKVDVCVWDRNVTRQGSVGHVMATEHNSRQVILSQFPFKQISAVAARATRFGRQAGG